MLTWHGVTLPGKEIELITKKDGYNYVLTTEAVTASVSSVNPQAITATGRYYGDTPSVTKAVYDMSNGNVTVTLGDAPKYDKYYKVVIGGQTYNLTTEEVLPAQSNSVSFRNAVISKNKKTATVNVYNTTYQTVTAVVKGVNSNGEEITEEVVIDAESVGSVTFTGTKMNTYTWSVTTK